MKTIIKITLLSLLLVTFSCSVSGKIKHKSSSQASSYRNAVMTNDGHIYISELSGALSYNKIEITKKNTRPSLELVWRQPSQKPAVMFEIQVADIDGNGSDDLLAASGDGTLYAWNSNGKLMWKFHPQPTIRLNEVAVIGEGKNMKIYTGGNNYKIYVLNNAGKQIDEIAVEGSIRKIESGNFTSKDKKTLFVYTLEHDKYYSKFFGFIDPDTHKIISSGKFDKFPNESRAMMQKASVADIDRDGLDDMLFFGAAQHAFFFAINSKLEKIADFVGNNKDSQRYAYGYGTSLLPLRNQIVMQRGGILYVLDNKGKLLHQSGTRYRGVVYNDLICDSRTRTLIGVGQIGGDNSLYYYNLDKNNWYDTKHHFEGREKEVENNINTLYEQVLSFKLPEYQKKKEKPYIVIAGNECDDIKKLNGSNVVFMHQGRGFGENTDRKYLADQIGDCAYKHDRRKKYIDSPEEIIAWAKEQETNKIPFILWAGHGTDPFYIQIATLEKIIDAAPTMCYGFLYAEMANTSDPRVVHFVRNYIPRLADVIHKNNSPAKIYFRYKNMFWGADCHTKLWREMFFSNKYNDILIPAAEDTNNRLQDINFSGRVGMWASGFVNDYAMRLIDDNPTSWRPLSPGGQRSISPFLRNGALIMAYGGRYAVNFNMGFIEKPGFDILYAIMKSGLIPVLSPKDILSFNSWMAVKDVDENYLEHTNNGHDLIKYSPADSNAVISRAGVHWCGAPVTNYDYSRLALGVQYRWLNFMPPMPSGMVPITDYEGLKKLSNSGLLNSKNTFISDIKQGYVKTSNGLKAVPAEKFGTIMKSHINKGAKNLLMTVDGASWCLFQIDKTHARLLLVDPGYIDPQEREITIHFNTKPKNAVDILSKETISIKQNMKLSVPAGSMRFIDFEFSRDDI